MAHDHPRAAAIARPQATGHAYLEEPFARCGNGVARDVLADAGGWQDSFCPDCEEVLRLGQPDGKRQHFPHTDAFATTLMCGGELPEAVCRALEVVPRGVV